MTPLTIKDTPLFDPDVLAQWSGLGARSRIKVSALTRWIPSQRGAKAAEEEIFVPGYAD